LVVSTLSYITYIKVKCYCFDRRKMTSHNIINGAGSGTADQLQEEDDFVDQEAVISKASRELGFIRFD